MKRHIHGFEWDEWNIDHIADHDVTQYEAEEVFELRPYFRRGPVVRGEQRHLCYGVTDAGRYLTVIFTLKVGGIARVVTARNMESGERRMYQRGGK